MTMTTTFDRGAKILADQALDLSETLKRIKRWNTDLKDELQKTERLKVEETKKEALTKAKDLVREIEDLTIPPVS